MTIDAYLAQLSQELSGLVTEEEREEFVWEQRSWLEGRLRDEILCGLPYVEAETKVTARNGEPRKLARRMAFEAYEDGVNTPVYNLLGRANVCANSVFGLLCGMYMCFLQLRIYMPTSSPIVNWKTPGELRPFIPSGLFDPDMTWQFLITVGFPFIAPLIAGTICGRLIPVGAARAVYNVVMLLIVGCFLMGIACLPDRTALFFAAVLALYWLPVGCLTTYLSSSFSLRLRRKRLERHGHYPSSPLTIQEKHSL